MIIRFYKLRLDNSMVIEYLIGAIGMMVLADHPFNSDAENLLSAKDDELSN